jgi:linoleate 10R-lipoxygenase
MLFSLQIERVVKLITLLPKGDSQAKLIAPIIQLGWNSLCHPPLSYLGDDFEYRTADGSNNV